MAQLYAPAQRRRGERSEVHAEGRSTWTIAVESPDAAAVHRAVEILGDQSRSGFDLHDTADLEPPVAGRPTLTLDLSAELGQVAVVR